MWVAALMGLVLLHDAGAFRVVKQARAGKAGQCCVYNGCDSCEQDPNAYCNHNETACAGDCGGIWCGGSTPTPVPTPTSAPSPPVPTPPPVSGSPVEQHGQLRVEGNKIVGEHGSPVQLRGMSMFWSQWMGKYWNAGVVQWLRDDWEVTMVRAAMGVDQGGYLENPGAEKARLEAVVDASIAAGIYVVIDWHDHHADQHVEQSKAFFSEMAQKYGGYPNVLFEVWNEPLQVDWGSVIKPYHEKVVPVIRHHSNGIIILGTSTWSQDVDVAAANPVGGENLAYTLHFYATTHKGGLRQKAVVALDRGVALVASEWGTCDASGNGALDLDSSREWINFMDQRHISWANWAVSDKPESASALVPGASASGGWSDTDLTTSGHFTRQEIRAGGTAPTPGGGGGGCCRFGADCGDCGEDGTGWCHESASNCAECTGTFDSSAQAPSCR